jgi:hypothetical protein
MSDLFKCCLMFSFVLGILKMTKVIYVSWWFVFAPIFIYWGILLCVCLILIYGFFNVLRSKKKYSGTANGKK